jgi:hypothetical protein
MNKLILILLIYYFNISSVDLLTLEDNSKLTCMSEDEAYITNKRYTNENVIWSEPKGILYGNLVGAKPAQKANLFPDKAATYFVVNIIIPKSGMLILKGQYPHVRYFSITVANQLGDGQLGNGGYIRGDQILPDSGSENPFLYLNNRNSLFRNYTVYIIQGLPPKEKIENNTLYTGVSSYKYRVHISIRSYLSNKGYDGTGNVKLNVSNSNITNGLPIVTLVLIGGKKIKGDELVTILQAEKKGDPDGYTKNQWFLDIERSEDKINSPSFVEPVSQLFWDTDYSVTGAFEAKSPKQRVINHPPSGQGGFANNPDTKYMVLPFSFGFGEVLVIRGKMPSHPVTWHGGDFLPKDPEVQYFSISTAAAPPSGEGWDTLCDEQIPTNENGTYTIVVSWPWNRPENAVRKNGISWLNPGSGEGHYIGARSWVGLIYFRFQNPKIGWKYSPSNIPIPTFENPIPKDPIIMGPFYPKAEYTSKLKFEKIK